jgi:hypothetical protein
MSSMEPDEGTEAEAPRTDKVKAPNAADAPRMEGAGRAEAPRMEGAGRAEAPRMEAAEDDVDADDDTGGTAS